MQPRPTAMAPLVLRLGLPAGLAAQRVPIFVRYEAAGRVSGMLENDTTSTSRHVSLEPGDVVFTGTPGATSAMKPGVTFEVEIAAVGTLTNKVVAVKPTAR